MTAEPAASTALVPTARAARYGKQLAAHLSRRLETSWDDGTSAGSVRFEHGSCAMTATPEGLALAIEVGADLDADLVPAQLDRMEDVVGRHLVRFGARDELAAHWVRADGSPGSSQTNTTAPDEQHDRG